MRMTHHAYGRPAIPSVTGDWPMEPAALRLGMPHLNAQGLCPGWLLRECAHLHWQAVARIGPGRPTELRDETGVRCFASIVSAVIDGPLAAFGEDMTVMLHTDEPPSAQNGWRSTARLVSGDAAVRVELVSAFARRAGTSNRKLEGAAMPPGMRPPRGVDLPARSRVLRARSRSFAIAAPDGVPPVASAPVTAAVDLNGVGLLYFANFLRFIAMGEEAVLAGPWTLPDVTRREVHWYGNADAGDTLDMTAEPVVSRTNPSPEVNCFSTVRRRSDGVLIAACETRWG